MHRFAPVSGVELAWKRVNQMIQEQKKGIEWRSNRLDRAQLAFPGVEMATKGVLHCLAWRAPLQLLWAHWPCEAAE